MNPIFNERTVRFRQVELPDIDLICDYWYRSPPGFLESMGIVREKMLPEVQVRQRHEAAMSSPEPDEELTSAAIVFEVEGVAVGIHPLTGIEFGKQGVLHAHIWRSDLRRTGLGSYTHPRACKYFMEKFKLEKVVFKTPVLNPGPNRVKQKMGLMPIAEVPMDAPFMKDGTMAYLYEVYPEQIERLLISGHI